MDDFQFVGNDDDTFAGAVMDAKGEITQTVLIPFGPIWGFSEVVNVRYQPFKVCPVAVHEEIALIGHSDRSRPK